MKLPPTLQGHAPALDVSGVLQLLETQRASGTFRLGPHFLRLRQGAVCKASGEPVSTVAALMGSTGRFEFRAVPGDPSGPLAHPITALLLEAARQADETRKP